MGSMSSGLISGTQGAASTTARPSAWLPLSAVPGRNAEQRSVEEKKVEAAGWSAIQTSVAICARCRESATDRNDTHAWNQRRDHPRPHRWIPCD
jgi:hypothetical protein